MTLGQQTVTLISITEDLDGPRDANGHPPEVRTETAVGGVRFRMVSTSETTDPGNRVRETWKLTAPPHPALSSATSRDEIRYDGVAYQIVGTPKALRDMDGIIHHWNITAERFLG